MVSPQIDQVPGKLGAVVGKQHFRPAALANKPVQHLDDVLASEPQPDLDRQTFAREHVDYRQRPELLAAGELIVDEVEALGLVRGRRLMTCLPLHDHLAPARPFGPQRQAFLAVEPIDKVAPDRPSAPTRRTSSSHAQRRLDGVRGSEVSRGGFMQDQLLKREIGDRVPEPLVLLLKLLQARHLVQLQPAELASRQR